MITDNEHREYARKHFYQRLQERYGIEIAEADRHCFENRCCHTRDVVFIDNEAILCSFWYPSRRSESPDKKQIHVLWNPRLGVPISAVDEKWRQKLRFRSAQEMPKILAEIWQNIKASEVK